MDTLQTPMGVIAICTAVAGVLLFGLASSLPSLLSPSITRLIGFGVVCAVLPTLWALSETWQLPALVGGIALGIMVSIHLAQTRKRLAPSGETSELDSSLQQ